MHAKSSLALSRFRKAVHDRAGFAGDFPPRIQSAAPDRAPFYHSKAPFLTGAGFYLFNDIEKATSRRFCPGSQFALTQ